MVRKKTAIRAYLRTRDGVCRYCGEEEAWDIEHVNPSSAGGTDSVFTNLVLACTSCNLEKGREEGFVLKDNQLTWHGTLVHPDGLYGAPLWRQVNEQRLQRQSKQGLTHLVHYKERTAV